MDVKVRDSNGAQLAEGDSVTLIKDLKLKGSSMVLKRGTEPPALDSVFGNLQG